MPPRGQRVALKPKSPSPEHAQAEFVMETLLVVLENFAAMGDLKTAGPHVHLLMELASRHKTKRPQPAP